MTTSAPDPSGQPSPSIWRAWAFLALVFVVVAVVLSSGIDRYVSLARLVENHRDLRGLIDRNAVLAIAIYLAAYAALVSLSVPCSIVFSVAGGFLFGGPFGALLAVIGATAGAIVIFSIARSTVGVVLAARAGPRVARLGAGFRDGAWSYLLFLRIVPLFPFWLVNIAPAFFNVPLRVFAPATLVGMIPATATFTFTGAALARMVETKVERLDACRLEGRADCTVGFDPSLVFTPTVMFLLLALAALALVPVVVKAVRGRKAGADAPRNRHL